MLARVEAKEYVSPASRLRVDLVADNSTYVGQHLRTREPIATSAKPDCASSDRDFRRTRRNANGSRPQATRWTALGRRRGRQGAFDKDRRRRLAAIRQSGKPCRSED